MDIVRNVSLEKYTTLKVGGNADYFAVVKSLEEVKEVIVFARDNNLSVFLLGGGSNILFPDQGFKGLVIKNEIKGIDMEGGENRDDTSVTVRVGAGENWDSFVKFAVERELWGVENLSGIPGTVGGAPVQNIGAYGQEVKETIVAVDTIDMRTGKEKIFSNGECYFGYRDSFFKTEEGRNYFIISITFKLSRKPNPNISYKDLKNHFGEMDGSDIKIGEIREAVLSIRKKKFPDLQIFGTAGSFFKNPIVTVSKFAELKEKYPDLPGYETKGGVKISLAWILDSVLGLKGVKKGNVRLFENQPIVLVAEKGSTAKEVGEFAGSVAILVKDRLGIDVEWEVRRGASDTDEHK